MKILNILILLLISQQSISQQLPTYIKDNYNQISKPGGFDITVEEFKNHDKKDLLNIPSHILKNYIDNEDFPTEYDLNLIGSEYGLPLGLLYAMFWKESQYRCNKVSEKNASGCFQFRPLTAKKMGILSEDYDYRSNPWISADAAARYLAWNFKYLKLTNPKNPENWKFAVAAYNAGPNKINKEGGLKIPLYTETQYYVEDIIGYSLGEKHIVQDGDLVEKISEEHNLHISTFRLLNGKVTNRVLQKGSFVTIKEPIKFYKYIVQPGDSISQISSLTGISIQLIGQTNNIKLLNSIESGQVLYLPLF